GLVQRQPVRLVPALEQVSRPVSVVVHGVAQLQHFHPAGSLAEEIPRLHRLALAHLVRGARRHVAGALYYRHSQFEPRLPDFFVWHVLPNEVGLDDFRRHHWHVPDCHVSVRPHSSHDLDLRIAHLAARVASARGGGGETMSDFSGNGPISDSQIYGLMAEFDSAKDLVAAAHKTHEAGYKKIDAYSPFPIEGLAEAIGFHKNNVPLIVLIGGLIGGISAYALQYWVAVITYPVNVGGRPFHSWPSFIIVTFELTILFGGLSSAIGMIVLNGLPMPYHPVFNVPEFAKASENKFFLVVESSDAKYDAARTRSFLSGLAPRMIAEVPS